MEVKKYLEENPNVQCDLEVTNTFLPLDLQKSPSKKFFQHQKGKKSVKSLETELKKFLQNQKEKESVKSLETEENIEILQNLPAKQFIYSHETGEIFEESNDKPAPCFDCHFP